MQSGKEADALTHPSSLEPFDFLNLHKLLISYKGKDGRGVRPLANLGGVQSWFETMIFFTF